MDKSLEDVKAEYKLSQEEHDAIKQKILDTYMSGKTPVEKPKAIFNFAPPGSGKTRLNGYGVQQFPDGNVIVINSDELKPMHPKADEVARLYPEYYTKVTDQESNPWTDALFDAVLQGGYNVIYEGTGRNKKLVETIKTQMEGYDEIIVRSMAVDESICLMSILERYQIAAKEKGWGRLVTLEHFYKAYATILETIDAMEKLPMIDEVEIYCRGEGLGDPKKIYGTREESKRFPNAKMAIIGGRQEDRKKLIQSFGAFDELVKEILQKRKLTEEEESIYMQVKKLYDELVNHLDENSEER